MIEKKKKKKNGSEVMPDSNGGTMTGNSGDGKAKISYIGE